MSDIGMGRIPQRIGRWPWGTLFGFAVIGFYIIFTIIAIAQHPQRVSPFDPYFILNLGNAAFNPDGAIFYNLAMILTGLAEVLFFIVIYMFYSQYTPKWLLFVGLLAGITNGWAVFMTGVNPMRLTNDISAHITWTHVSFFSFFPVLVAFGLAFWRVKGVLRYIGLYGFAACAIDIFFFIALLSRQISVGLGMIMQWFSIFSYLVWIALISLDVLVRSRIEPSMS